MNTEKRKTTWERQTIFLILLPLFTGGGYLLLRDETMAIRKSENLH